MAITLTLTTELQYPLELGAMSQLPEGADPLRTAVLYGNREVPLGELFRAEGSTSDGTWIWRGDLHKARRLGANWSRGRLIMEGDAGLHAGAEMSGGEVTIIGQAGHWCGAEMSGGTLRVRGDAGDFAGGAYPGSRRGMTGGRLLIDGAAGAESGAVMRRGLIVVHGELGPFAGCGMIAGTIVSLGSIGPRFGAGMKRGTIAAFGTAAELLPTFRFACRYAPTFLNLLIRELNSCGFAPPSAEWPNIVDRYCGDLLEGGRGEAWLAG